uniref:Tripartite motif containing 110 n=1 Tax=Hucho hucho TaxID=62062 RepID=A0A4W5RVC4_9TELE
MVTKSVAMASLAKELTCSLCRDVFCQAQSLLCGHSFCPACVRDTWGHREAGVRGRFTCAQCQEEQGVVACDCCPPVGDKDQAGTTVAVKTCLRCEVSLCAEHLQPHLERPAFKTHLLVEPLGDLSHRRCPTHKEMFLYYCADERVYVCSECLLEGGHAQHRIKGLRKVQEDLKVILKSLRQKADEKLNEGERILQEHQNTDLTITVSNHTHLLIAVHQFPVHRLVLALRESTLSERQKVMERLQNDCSRVREDLSKTQDIHHYLASLLEETDPFLLIWQKQVFRIFCKCIKKCKQKCIIYISIQTVSSELC